MELSLNRIELLHPQFVPNADEVDAWILAHPTFIPATGRSADAAALAPTMPATSVLDQVNLVLASFDHSLMQPSAEKGNDEDAAHDDYFHVQRVDGDKVAIFLHMLVAGRAVLLDEVSESSGDAVDQQDASAAPETWQAIDHGLVEITRALMPLTAEHTALLLKDATPETLPIKPGAQVNPRRRWIRGHQLFAILTQALLYSLRELAQAIRMDSKVEMDRYIALSHSLLQGSGRAFTFTGGFSIEEYMQHIRPTMMPPFVPMSLSGLMSNDHRSLVRVLRDMRPALKALRVQDAAGHDSLADALSEVYELHKHVCERFVGKLPSIRTAETTDKSGPTIIEQFRKLRLKPFEQD